MNTENQQKEFILTAPLKKVVWKLSIPTITAMVLFSMNSFLDAIFVGQLVGESALSGVALAGAILSVVIGIGTWVGTGAANVLSNSLGSDDAETSSKILGTATRLILIISIILFLPVYFFSESLIGFMGGIGTVLELGTDYFQTIMFGTVFWVYGLVLNLIVRAEGKVKKAATMSLYGLAVNAVLSPVFIIYLDMGVEGAAWATNLAMFTYSVVGFFYFKRGKASFKANILSLKYSREVGKKMITTGFPSFILTTLSLIQSFVVFNVIVDIGVEKDLSFYAATNRILLFLIAPLFGLSRAFQPVAGINYGAGNFARLKDSFKLFVISGFLIVGPLWIVMMILPSYSLSIILPDTNFTAADIEYFRVVSCVLLILPFMFISFTLFPAIEKSKYASLLGLLRQLILYIPVMIFLPRVTGLAGVYYGAMCIEIIVVLVTAYVVWSSFKQLVSTDISPDFESTLEPKVS